MNKLIIGLSLVAILFSACKKTSNGDPDVISLAEGVFIVNQGNFTVGNSSLSYFEPGALVKYNNLFSSVNNIPLGDVAQSITIDDSNAYIVVNNSGVIHVIDRWSAEVKGKISQLGSPRYMLKISDTKAYVSDLFKNSVTIINPTTYEVIGSIQVDRSTEEMVQFGSEVFAANWSGYNQTLLNNKVLIIDENQDKMVDSITVGIEPNSMVLDKDNNIWVLCSGGYDNAGIPSLWKIDAATHAVKDTLFFPVIELNPVSLEINGAGDSLFYINNGIFRMSVGDTALPDSAFIKQDDERTFMVLGVDPKYGDIYASNPLDYQKNGKVYRYSAWGSQKSNMEVGIVPGAFGFNY